MSTTPNPIASQWQTMRKARRIMVVAIGLLFVSQFFTYHEYSGTGTLSVDADWNTYGTYWPDLEPVGTGWQIHPQAWIVIPALAIVYFTAFCERAWWRRWGYLASVFLVMICLAHGQQWVTGTRLGLGAWALSIWSAVQNRNERKAAEPPAIP
ncbi:MAG TPA: hypothetical protein VG713_05870 [Pirellulales bacterium]|nr:hypothetical protein [Pirellulales bacterium]